MRKLLLAFLLISSFIFGQDQNFTVSNKHLQWQKVYNTTLSFNDVLEMVEKSGKFYDISSSENMIDIKFKDFEIDYVGAGNHFISVTEYIESSVFSGNALVEYKDGKYRVTIKNITYQYSISKLKYRSPKQIVNIIENKALDKNSNISSRFKKDAFMFDYSFNNLFDFNNSIKNDNW